jgi:hypothetical protein
VSSVSLGWCSPGWFSTQYKCNEIQYSHFAVPPCAPRRTGWPPRPACDNEDVAVAVTRQLRCPYDLAGARRRYIKLPSEPLIRAPSSSEPTTIHHNLALVPPRGLSAARAVAPWQEATGLSKGVHASSPRSTLLQARCVST